MFTGVLLVWKITCAWQGCLEGGVGGRVRACGPLEGVAIDGREEHVPDEGLDGGLAHQSDEEELLYHRGGHGPEGGQSEQQLAEPGGLVGVLGPAVLLQRALRLLLQLLDHLRRRQPHRV